MSHLPARNTDPDTSHEAARDLVDSGTQAQQHAQVASALRQHPGLTSRELAFSAGLDRHMVARRLPELEAEGLAGRMAVHQASIGFDASGRDAVLQKAIAAGQLAYEQVAEHLALPSAAPAFKPIALLAGRVEPSPNADARTRTRLRELAELLGSEPTEVGSPETNAEMEVRHAA